MNAINELVKMSTYEILEDGCVTFFFQGKVSKSVIDAIEKASDETNKRVGMITYYHKDNFFSWSAKQTSKGLSFTYNDYHLPSWNNQ